LGLLKALEGDADFDVRLSAAVALGEIDSERAIPGLLKALEDTAEDLVSYHAAEALVRIGSEQAIPELIKVLNHDDPIVQDYAANALGRIGSETTIPWLLKAIENGDSNLSNEAVEAFEKIKGHYAAYALPHLLSNITSSQSVHESFRALSAIQSNCQFYNYDIAQLKLEPLRNNHVG
jgi:HEAT repeat protein